MEFNILQRIKMSERYKRHNPFPFAAYQALIDEANNAWPSSEEPHNSIRQAIIDETGSAEDFRKMYEQDTVDGVPLKRKLRTRENHDFLTKPNGD
jgi:hypothetical protein